LAIYILNRCIAPEFGLDPTGFAGYLFVTNATLVAAMNQGKLLRAIKKNEEPLQLKLFD